MISPLLANIYLSAFDDAWSKRCARLGVLVRYADDLAVICKTASDCRESERRARKILAELKLELHPDKTRRVELSWGKQGSTFSAATCASNSPGPCGSEAVNASTSSSIRRAREAGAATRKGAAPEVTMSPGSARRDRVSQPGASGWGQYFRTGNASAHFHSVDRYVVRRLKRLRISRKARHLKQGGARRWTPDYFYALRLYRLLGTIAYPEAA